MGDNDVWFTFWFFDDSGDYYYGEGYADEADGYYEGLRIPTEYGYYEIDFVYAFGSDQGHEGHLWVNEYHDAESGLEADASAVGWNGLGSEYGIAWDDQGMGYWDYFGNGGEIDANLLANDDGNNDVFYTWEFTAFDGDAWGGYGYADRIDDFQPGDSWTTAQGTYTLTSILNAGLDNGWEGYVEATWGYDVETDQLTWDATAVGDHYLGSESGSAFLWDGTEEPFGGEDSANGYDDIDFPNPDGMLDVYYTWYYMDENGDYLGGYGFADASAGVAVGDRTATEHGEYVVSGVLPWGIDSNYQGYVEATWGYDAESGLFSYSAAWGTDGLGSEEGEARFQDGVTDWFGGDLSEGGYDPLEHAQNPASTHDVGLAFWFYDDGGDEYWGLAVADAGDGYYEGQTWHNGYGTYEILLVENSGMDQGLEGAILVQEYYDYETDQWGWTDAWGDAGFGSEEGFAYGYAYGSVGHFGGGGLLDADFLI